MGNERDTSDDADRPTAEDCRERGITKARDGDHEAAIGALTEAIDRGADDADTYYRRGRARVATDAHEAAVEDLTRAIDRGRDDPEVYCKRATARLQTGAIEAAADDFDRALSACRDGDGDRACEADCLYGLGVVARTRGDLAAAATRHRDSLALARETGATDREAVVRDELGLIARLRGDLDDAESHHRAALDLAREGGHRRTEANSLNNLGIVARARGDLEAAETYHRQSVDIERDLGTDAGVAMSLNNLGAVARQRGDLDGAEEYFEESLALASESGAGARERAMALGNLAGTAAQQQRWAQASEWADRAADAFLEAGSPADALDALRYLVESRDQMADPAGVLAACERLLDCYAAADLDDDRRDLLAWTQERIESAADEDTHGRAADLLVGLVDRWEALEEADRATDACDEALGLAGLADRPALRRRLKPRFVRLAGRTMSAAELYNEGLTYTMAREWATAAGLYAARLRGPDGAVDVGRGPIEVGVFFAATLALLARADGDPAVPVDVETTPSTILDRIAPYRGRLDDHVRALFDQLYEADSTTDPDELAEPAEDLSPLSTEWRERQAAAVAVDALAE